MGFTGTYLQMVILRLGTAVEREKWKLEERYVDSSHSPYAASCRCCCYLPSMIIIPPLLVTPISRHLPLSTTDVNYVALAKRLERAAASRISSADHYAKLAKCDAVRFCAIPASLTALRRNLRHDSLSKRLVIYLSNK